MGYTLDQYSADCRAALLKDPGPAGREIVRQFTERACTDSEFVAKYLGPDAEAERRILYEDPDLRFCILAHVYKGATHSFLEAMSIAPLADRALNEAADWLRARLFRA